MDATHLSPQAHQRLSAELEELSTVRRKEISEWLERAREHGDIRENADYDAAKNAQGLNEARIRQIEALLKKAVVVESPTGDKVAAGTVTVALPTPTCVRRIPMRWLSGGRGTCSRRDALAWSIPGSW